MIFQPALPSTRRLSPRLVLVGGGLIAASLLVLISSVAGLNTLLLPLALMAVTGLAAWRWPVAGAVFFVAFTPVNRFVLLVFFHFAGGGALTRFGLLWKEGLLAVLLVRVLTDLLFPSRTTARHIRYLDLLLLLFILMNAVYLVYPGPQETDLFTRVQGFRTDASFLLAYFVGRGLHLERRHVRWLLVALIPGSLCVGAVAVWQFLAPNQANVVFSQLGLQDFITLQGAAAADAIRSRGIGGLDLPRASSLQLGDLALAFFQIVLVGVAAALFYESRSGRRRAWTGAFLLLMIVTLLFTVTRSAVIALGPILVFGAIFARSAVKLLVLLAVMATVGLAAFTWYGADATMLQKLIDPSEGSTQSHLVLFDRSIDTIASEPLGHGLGTAGEIGHRQLGGRAINNENWYLQLASEMGPLAALLYLAAVVLMVMHCVGQYRRVKDPWLRTLTLGVASGGVGFLVEGNFLHAWDNTVLSMMFWLLAGIAVSVSQFERKEVPA
jgi:O-antigen ligase/polysaccharide polymerase Wzy-like membrane protein